MTNQEKDFFDAVQKLDKKTLFSLYRQSFDANCPLTPQDFIPTLTAICQPNELIKLIDTPIIPLDLYENLFTSGDTNIRKTLSQRVVALSNPATTV